MSWTLASVYMYIGYLIRRRGWAPDMTIGSKRTGDHFIATTFINGEPTEVCTLRQADLDANDWELTVWQSPT